MTSNSESAAVSTSAIAKSFSDVRAVAGVDLQVPRGSFYGIAGPNGAGKTTLIRMLPALLVRAVGTAGGACVEVWPDPRKAKAALGYVPDNPVLFTRLTASEMLEFSGLLRGMGTWVIAERSQDLLRVLDLADTGNRLIADFSLGITKRMGLAVALLHSPQVLILDEPFGSLDPVNTNVMEEMLERYRSGGGTVVFSSHVMEVVQKLCDRLVIIDHGTVRAEGTVAEISKGRSLQDAFVALVGGRELEEGDLGWLSPSSD